MLNPAQQSFAKLKRLVRYVKRERQCGQTFSYGKNGRRRDNVYRFRLGRLQANSKIIKRRRDTARQSRLESTHAQAKDHCKKQCTELYAAALGASESEGIVSLLKDLVTR